MTWPCVTLPSTTTKSGRCSSYSSSTTRKRPSSCTQVWNTAAPDVVYYLVHSLGASDFEERDRAAATTTARAAEQSGVRQLVYLLGLADRRHELSRHLRSRAETADVLASGGVPVTTFRAAMVVGAGSAAFETIVALVDRLPAMICPRWVSTPTQPIALRDIVQYLAGVAGQEGTLGNPSTRAAPTS